MDEAGGLRGVAELAAEARDVDVERLRRAEPVGVPDLVDEPLARDDAAGLADQQQEQLELLAGEVHFLAAHARCSPGRVDEDRADLERAVLSGGRRSAGR